MMKGIVTIFIAFMLFCSCQDDENTFGISMPKENLSFRPTAGGAVMHYTLPDDKDILAIRIRYQDVYGKELVCTGSYACDSLLIVGFNEARENVEAAVTLCHRNGNESEPVMVTFNTEDSGPVAFFKDLDVKSSWEGFSVTYNLPANVSGMAHIFYVGQNPLTKEPDTLLMTSFALKAGNETLPFQVQQQGAEHTVVIRTEDFRGYMVKQGVWENVAAYSTKLLSGEELEFTVPSGCEMEDEAAKIGVKYLFDRDIKGETCTTLPDTEFKTFLAGPDAVGKPFILDLKKNTLPAMLRIYAMLQVRKNGNTSVSKYWEYFQNRYKEKLPCEVYCYGSNDMNDDDSWTEIGRFYQHPELQREFCWARYSFDSYVYVTTPKEIELAEPAYMQMDFPADGEEYRYLKLVIEDTFVGFVGSDPFYYNPGGYVTFHELEVYVKKD